MTEKAAGRRACGDDAGKVGRAVLCPPPPANNSSRLNESNACQRKRLHSPRRRARSDAPYRRRCQAGTVTRPRVVHREIRRRPSAPPRTLRAPGNRGRRASVLECGGPPPLSNVVRFAPAGASPRTPNGRPLSSAIRSLSCFFTDCSAMSGVWCHGVGFRPILCPTRFRPFRFGRNPSRRVVAFAGFIMAFHF